AVVVGDDPELRSRLTFLQNATGAILDPFSSFLGLRGIKTLPLRLERHAANALAVANWLETHPQVERVIYPFLASHPRHELARRQMQNGGGMVSVFLKAVSSRPSQRSNTLRCLLWPKASGASKAWRVIRRP